MTPEDKQLLIKDLCARLPYHVIVKYRDANVDLTKYVRSVKIEECKPYLRPMSSMTNEEMDELKEMCSIYIPTDSKNIGFEDYGILVFTHHLTDNSYSFKLNLNVIDWLNKKMFDYHGLIEKGLALETPEGMYKQI